MTNRPDIHHGNRRPATGRRLYPLLLAWLAVSGAVAAPGDDYLKAIRDEVKDLNAPEGVDRGDSTTLPPFLDTPPSPPPPPAPPPMPRPGPAVEGQTREQFEHSLRAVYPGSFYLLRKLPAGAQQDVLHEYEQTGDLLRIRQMIMDLARNQ